MLKYRALGSVFLPEGNWNRREIKANEVISILEEDAGDPTFRKWVESGLLRPEPEVMPVPTDPIPSSIRKLSPPVRWPDKDAEPSPAPPTAREVVLALQKHPGLYEAVKTHFEAEFVETFKDKWEAAEMGMATEPNANGDVYSAEALHGAVQDWKPHERGRTEMQNVMDFMALNEREERKREAAKLAADEAQFGLPLPRTTVEPSPPEEPKGFLASLSDRLFGR